MISFPNIVQEAYCKVWLVCAKRLLTCCMHYVRQKLLVKLFFSIARGCVFLLFHLTAVMISTNSSCMCLILFSSGFLGRKDNDFGTYSFFVMLWKNTCVNAAWHIVA